MRNIIKITTSIALTLLTYTVFVFLFLGLSIKNAEAEEIKPKYIIDFKDSVIENKFYRFLIVYKDNEVVAVKNCSAKELLNKIEKTVCNFERKVL